MSPSAEVAEGKVVAELAVSAAGRRTDNVANRGVV
jgi:hypothetical protein